MIWFLHGNLGTPADGEHVMRILNSSGYETRSLSLWDLLSEGSSSLEESGARLARFIEKTDSSPLLLAYSLGGRLALHALRYLPSCKAAFLIGAHFGLTGEEEKRKRQESDGLWAWSLRNNDWDYFYRQWTAQPVFQSCQNTHRSTPDGTTKERMALAFECWSLGRQENQLPLLSNHLKKTPVPLFLLTGEYDLKFTELCQTANRALPHCRHLIIPGAGHRVLEDAPDYLSTALLDIIPSFTHAQPFP